MAKNFLIIGSGFNALATAHYLKNKNHDVKLIFEREIKGVLGSVKIENEKFDLGYQFFDGLDKETDKFIRNMFNNEDLYDFGYGASTFSNNVFYKDHAIPYWMSYGKIFVFKAFLFYLRSFLASFFIKKEKKINSLADLYRRLPPNIRNIMSKGCEKHYQIKPEKLEASAHQMSTFTNFRQTLFNDAISNFLKKSSRFFDKHLASRRKSNSTLDCISLYPIKKNMEYITDKLIVRLKKQDVIFEKNSFDSIDLVPDLDGVKFNNEIFDQVLITTSLTNIQRLFNFNMGENYEHYVSQVFVYFTIEKCDFKFQYLHINDLNLFCSRLSNCSFYSKKTSEKNHVLIAEIPLNPKNKIWDDDCKLKEIAWNEILLSGIVEDGVKYKSYKILKISKTFPVPKLNFFNFLNKIEFELNNKFSGKVTLLGQGIFTRHHFLKELFKKLAK